MKENKKITLGILKFFLNYDANTGVFIWKNLKHKANKISVGDVAGCINSKGYNAIKVDGKLYLGHILAWFYVYGVWPKCQIDHINNIRNDNRIENLREASHLENCYSKGLSSLNTSGYKGVRIGYKDSWYAYIKFNGKYYHLGQFKSKEEAALAYNKKALEFFGEFAKLNIIK